MGKRILQLTEAELAEIQASGFLPVAVSGETFRLAINKLLANWKPWATEPTKGSLEISTTQYPATIPVKIGGTICGYLVPAPPTNETGVVLSWVDEETGFAWREDSVKTIEHILDLSALDEENTTFNVVLTANRNNAISFVGSSEETAIVSIEIENDKSYHIQIVGACTLEITGIEWWGDAITDITNKSEINIMNGRAMGVLIDV